MKHPLIRLSLIGFALFMLCGHNHGGCHAPNQMQVVGS